MVNPKTGKFPTVFSPENAQPFSERKVPCGRCTGCRIDKTSEWSLRMDHERRYHVHNCFITTTYDDLHLPKHGQLVPIHLSKLIRAIRKKFPHVKVRFYGVGEYGENTTRKYGHPHYHISLFGVDFHEDRRPFKKNDMGDQLWTSATLDKLWGKGHCVIGALGPETTAYVARYVMKKLSGDLALEKYERVDEDTGEIYQLHPPFARMSNRPGIGYDFFQEFKKDMYARDSCISKGKPHVVPGYYDVLLGREDPAKLEKIKRKRIKKARLRADDNTPERLAVREEVKEATLQTLTRKL